MKAASSSDDLTKAQRARIEREYPLLSYYYGIPPSEAAVMPRWLRSTYIERLQEILATEQIRAIEAATFPHMEVAARRSTMRRLERIAKIGEQVQKPKTPQDIAAIGIPVTIVDKEGNVVETHE